MSRFLLLLIGLGIAASVVPPASAQEATLIIENGRVFVGNGTVLEQASVVVAGSRIVSVTEDSLEAPDVPRIDAAGKTVLPGLIDTHVHLLMERITSLPRSDAELQAFVQEDLPDRLRALLESGITTVMSTGDFWPAIREVRERLRKGELTGPRVFTAGPVFTAPGGHPAAGGLCGPWGDREANPWCREHIAAVVDDREQVRDAVARLARQGVDHVKMVYDDRHPPGVEKLKAELVGEIVRAAHDHGLRAYAHIIEIRSAIQAVEAGLDGLVHIPLVSVEPGDRERLVRLMRDGGVTASTTLVVYDELIADFRRAGNESVVEGLMKDLELSQRMLAVLAEGDDRLIALGTDTPQLPPGDAYHREIHLVAEAGLTPSQIVHAATRNAAAHMGREEELGTLEPGKLADLIIVDGNPLEDLSALRSLEVVVKGGEVVVSR